MPISVRFAQLVCIVFVLISTQAGRAEASSDVESARTINDTISESGESEEVSTEIYKWVDEKGIVHFGDRKGGGVETKKIEIKPTEPISKQSAEESHAELMRKAQEAEQRLLKKELDAKKDELKREALRRDRKDRCYQATVDIVLLKTETPVFIDSNGRYRPRWYYDPASEEGRVYLDDRLREIQMSELFTTLKNDCDQDDFASSHAAAMKYWKSEKACSKYREQLGMLLKPNSRTLRKDIEENRKLVKQHCIDS